MKLVAKIICGMLIVFAPLLAANEIALPNMGDPSGALISPEQERKLGEAMMRQVRQSLAFVSDPEINEYINSLGYRLASFSHDPDQSFTFFVISDPMINAFATPGGFIGVNSGLIMATRSESELASVLSHEIAHVTQKHLARAYQTYSNMQIPILAAIVVGLLIGTQNPEAGSAAIAAAQAGSAQRMIDFTRTNEQEADRLGIQSLANAGFDTHAMADFFGRMQQATRLYGNLLPEFLSTHPVTTNRIAEAQERASQYKTGRPGDSLDYHLTRYKLQVLESQDRKTLVSQWQEQFEKGQYRSAIAHTYGMALALLEAGNPHAAQELIHKLRQQDRERIAFIILDARAQADTGQYARAKRIFEEALKLYPHNHPLTMHYARLLLTNREGELAYALLDNHSRRNVNDPETFKLLAQAAGDSGHKAEAHFAMAEYYYLNGHLNGAIQQLNLARGFVANNYYLGERVEARMREFEREQANSRPLP